MTKVIKKDVTLAGVLSFLLPGAGQIYCGKAGRGILFMIGYFVGICFFIIPGIVMLIVAVCDAVNLAKEINK